MCVCVCACVCVCVYRSDYKVWSKFLSFRQDMLHETGKHVHVSHMCVCVSVHVRVCPCMCACVCPCVHAFVCVCVCVCPCICVFMHECVSVWVCLCIATLITCSCYSNECHMCVCLIHDPLSLSISRSPLVTALLLVMVLSSLSHMTCVLGKRI